MLLPDDPPVYAITPAEYRMRLVVGWIEHFQCEHGLPPTMREVGAYMGLSSTRNAVEPLYEMRDYGFVTWEPRLGRTLTALEGPPLGVVRRESCAPKPSIMPPGARRWAG
jgi:SOS-response transcriptional repressor LexA